MAVESERPYGAFRFDVAIARRRLECAAVVLPRLVIDEAVPGAPDDAARYLVLRRGYPGSLELYDWWQGERQAKRTRGRRVTVDLLDERGRPVTRWQFDGCRPVALDYSPLDAATSAIVVESISLTFESATMS
jgi:hypothetical protein